MEQEKRLRREIANSNERRRMQSINAGFTSLKTLLPHQEGEKLSKASILQQTADYIYQLEQEKTRLLAQNCQLKRLLNQHHHSDVEASPSGAESPNDDRSTNANSPVILSSTVLPEQCSPSTGIEVVLSDSTNQFQVSKGDRNTLNPEVRTDLLRTELLKTNNSSSYNNCSRSPRPDRDGSSKRIKLEEHKEVDTECIQIATIQDSEHRVSFDPKGTSHNVKVERPSPSGTPVVKEEEALDGESATTIPKYAKMILKSHSGMPVNSARNGSISMLNNSTTTYALNVTEGHPTSSNFRISTNQSTTPATIVTVLPSAKCDMESLPPVLELHSINEGGASMQPKGTISRRGSNFSNGGTVDLYIVNSSPSNCQKSLDTICEAIRHLEGDHMFPQEEERHHLLQEEEVMTEETNFSIDGSQQRLITLEEHSQLEQQQHHHHHPIVLNNGYQFDAIDAQGVVIGQQMHVHNHPHHHLSGTPLTILDERTAENHHSLDLTTLPLIEEPQEAPLELTTTHRGASSSGEQIHHSFTGDLIRGEPTSEKRVPSLHSNHSISSIGDDRRDNNVIHIPQLSSTKHSMRPGVIVVQQP